MKWNIGNKIGSLIIVAVLIFIVLGFMSYLTINKLIESSAWNTHTHQVLYVNEVLISDMKDAETGQRGYIITGNEIYLEPFNIAQQSVYINLKQLIELTKDNPNQQKRLESYKLFIDEKFAELQETIKLRKEKGFDAALAIVLSDKGKIIMDNFRKVANEFENEENKLLASRMVKMDNNATATESIIIYGNILAILVLSIFGVYLVRNISIPLITVTNLANQISKGDLTVDISITERKDEVGLLRESFKSMQVSMLEKAHIAKEISEGNLAVDIKLLSEKDTMGFSFKTMVEKLRSQLGEIGESINVLSSSSSEIMASVTQLASTSVETATSVSETTTTVEEVKQTAEVSSFKAKEVSDKAANSAAISLQGETAIENAIEGMYGIQKQMESIANIIVRLSEQSQTISEITSSVNEIAEQSNLLAVNAAIEAAKAGEQGKGFGVVAQEIKNLSERSKEANLQIRNILRDVQKSISTAVMATEEGNKVVNEGLKLNSISGESIKALSESVNDSVNAAIQIAASSIQQLEGMDQIATAMESIKEASLQASTSTQQSAVAVKDIQQMAENLSRLMKQYKM